MTVQNFFSILNECMLIAEIGVNHNGDMILAKEMIDAAKESGADAVKFQTFKAETLVSQGTPKVKYQESTTSPQESHFEMIKSLELSRDNHFLLSDYCLKKEIKFLSTPYDIESAKFLNEDLNLEIFKTASADLIDLPLHEYIAESGKPVIISVGMSSLGEIEENLNIYNSYKHRDVILLHCVSNYPCAHENLNLRVLKTLKQAFDLPVGYSDHSIGSEAAILSIGLGAKIIEKHFTLDKNLSGPDHLASSTPAEFKSIASSVRNAEKILGSSIKICQQEEKQMAEVSRKSIVMKEAAKAGTVLSTKNLCVKRPGTGLSPKLLYQIYGLKLSVDKDFDELLKLTDFE
jgi:N-acetylneuraminate synthase/N,N'-diacetyllegionaminate synthase